MKNVTQRSLDQASSKGNYDFPISDFDCRTTKRLARYLRHNFKLAVEDRKFLSKLGRRKRVTETQRLRVVRIADQFGVSVKGWLL